MAGRQCYYTVNVEHGNKKMTNSIKTISLREDVISCIKNHKEEIHSTFDVDSLAIFGSVAKGIANAQSDVDILVRYTMTQDCSSISN